MAKLGNNLEHVRAQNSESIREIIYKYGPISRSEVAAMLQLTPPTITTNVSELIRRGLVRECGTDEGENPRRSGHTLGRRRILVEFVPDAAYTIGVEIGIQGTLACLVDLSGNVIRELQYTDISQNYKEVMNSIAEGIRELLDETGTTRDKIAGVGIGMPGFVDRRSGVLRYGAVHKWKDKAVAEDITRRTGFACQVENNARCRALDEDLFSKKLLPDTFAYLLISRGLACPLMIRNRLHAGETAGAGEVGHMVVERFGPICPTCGNRGCVEAIASETAIRGRCIQAVAANAPTLLPEICANPLKPTISEILQAQHCGDRVVSVIMEDAIAYLGIMLANIINFVNPPLVIVDGYIMGSEDNQRLFIEATQKNCFSLNGKNIKIKFVEFDKFRAAKGAAALAVKKYILQEGR